MCFSNWPRTLQPRILRRSVPYRTRLDTKKDDKICWQDRSAGSRRDLKKSTEPRKYPKWWTLPLEMMIAWSIIVGALEVQPLKYEVTGGVLDSFKALCSPHVGGSVLARLILVGAQQTT